MRALAVAVISVCSISTVLAESLVDQPLVDQSQAPQEASTAAASSTGTSLPAWLHSGEVVDRALPSWLQFGGDGDERVLGPSDWINAGRFLCSSHARTNESPDGEFSVQGLPPWRLRQRSQWRMRRTPNPSLVRPITICRIRAIPVRRTHSLRAENPDSVWSPETDRGTFAVARKRVESGGWTRQVTARAREAAHPYGYMHLKQARLPIPTRPRTSINLPERLPLRKLWSSSLGFLSLLANWQSDCGNMHN
jgi:hypothetical protein